MRFALLGEHPDGVALSQALVDTGRHQLAAVSGVLDADQLQRLGEPRIISDVEEILADPAIDVIVVAGSLTVREQQLRRALQSERDVLCVHPCDPKPDLAYEAAMLQSDVKRKLVPVLPRAMHPAIVRLSEFASRQSGNSRIGSLQLLSIEIRDPLETAGAPWDVVRRLGGEIAEVAAFAEREDWESDKPALLGGRFGQGGLFHLTLLPANAKPSWRFFLSGTGGEVELHFPLGWHGPAFLRHGDDEESWPIWDGWSAVVQAFESDSLPWHEEVRMLELDDAARRSIERRRSHAMEYQEANEEVGFKGTMAMTGCALMWFVLALLIVSVWLPWAGWMILPLLIVFVSLQLFRYVLPRPEEKDEP